jgi:hypothetical protein
MLRHGEIDIALVFRYADAPVEDEGFRLLHIGNDPIYLISQRWKSASARRPAPTAMMRP